MEISAEEAEGRSMFAYYVVGQTEEDTLHWWIEQDHNASYDGGFRYVIRHRRADGPEGFNDKPTSTITGRRAYHQFGTSWDDAHQFLMYMSACSKDMYRDEGWTFRVMC